MVNAISSGGGGYDTASLQQAESQAADRIFKAVDTNHDGKITEDELSQAMQAQGGQQGASAAELFKQLDQGGKGYITKQDLEAALATTDQAQSAQKQAPKVRGGGGGGEGGGAASLIQSYDPEDLNYDGRVTMQERVQYALQVYEAQKEAQAGQQTSVYG